MKIEVQTKEFSIYRLQFLIEETLFPTSDNLPEKAGFVRDVLEDSARSMKYRNRKWVITHPRLLSSLSRTLLVGTIGYIKDRPVNVYDYDKLEFITEKKKDAELLRFVIDGERELLAIQKSKSFDEEVVLERLEQLFHLASPEVRQNRIIKFYAVSSGSNLISQVEESDVRRFIAHIRRPNANLKGQFDKYFGPLQEGNNSDQVDITWWSKIDELSVRMTGAFRAAVLVIEGGFGDWTAWVRSSTGKLRRIRSSDKSIRRMLNASSDETLAADADSEFRMIEETLGNGPQQEAN